MNSDCEKQGIGRRDLLKFGAAGVVALGLGGVSRQARAAEGAPTALSPDEALAKLKAEKQALRQPSGTLLDRPCGAARRSSGTPGAMGDDHQLRRQPRSAGTDLRRPRRRRALRCQKRWQSGRHCDARHGRIRRGRAWLATHRRPGPHQLRRREGRMRRCH